MQTHNLKIDAHPFSDLLSGAKTGEVRNDDRGFEVGDNVHLTCIDGRTMDRTISHIQRGYGLPDGICVLSYTRPAAPVEGLVQSIIDFLEADEDNIYHLDPKELDTLRKFLQPSAPVEGLETVEYQVEKNGKWYSDHPQSWAVRKNNGATVRRLCNQSQAEAIIAAERDERGRVERIRDFWFNTAHSLSEQIEKLEADNAALTARVKGLGDERYKLAYAITGGEDAPGYLDSLSVETLVEVARKNTQHWFAETDRADKAETKLAAYEKQLSKDRKLRNEAQCDADLWRFSVDMGDHPSLLVKVWRQRKALETQLAAAKKALEEIEMYAENIRLVLVTQLTEPMRSAFWKGVAIRNRAQSARAALEAKP
ncbi:DUF3850 domain-containing protein [Brucella sp. TWI432]